LRFRIENLGKQARDESGKDRVNKNAEGNFAIGAVLHSVQVRSHGWFQCLMDFKEWESSLRHCEPTGRRKAPPDDRLREAIQLRENKAGLLRRRACHRARVRATRWLLAMTATLP
jgi:hypothetical protein